MVQQQIQQAFSGGWSRVPEAIDYAVFLSKTEKTAYRALLKFAKKDYTQLNPKLKTLAKQVGLSHHALGRGLRSLERKGLVAIRRTGRASIYELATLPSRSEVSFANEEFLSAKRTSQIVVNNGEIFIKKQQLDAGANDVIFSDNVSCDIATQKCENANHLIYNNIKNLKESKIEKKQPAALSEPNRETTFPYNPSLIAVSEGNKQIDIISNMISNIVINVINNIGLDISNISNGIGIPPKKELHDSAQPTQCLNDTSQNNELEFHTFSSCKEKNSNVQDLKENDSPLDLISIETSKNKVSTALHNSEGGQCMSDSEKLTEKPLDALPFAKPKKIAKDSNEYKEQQRQKQKEKQQAAYQRQREMQKAKQENAKNKIGRHNRKDLESLYLEFSKTCVDNNYSNPSSSMSDYDAKLIASFVDKYGKDKFKPYLDTVIKRFDFMNSYFKASDRCLDIPVFNEVMCFWRVEKWMALIESGKAKEDFQRQQSGASRIAKKVQFTLAKTDEVEND